MPIERIEGLTYGVKDLEICAKFLADAGLELISSDETAYSFRSVENQIVTIVDQNNPSLPKSIEEGPTLREMTWGVRDVADLDNIAAALADNATNATIEDGVVRTVDPNGLALAFRVADREMTEPVFQSANQNQHVERVNERLGNYGAPKPVRIVHVALNITKAIKQQALDFYTRVLRFKPIDIVLDTGTFLQSEGDIEHHNFFLCFRPDKAGMNHFAVELYNFDAVMEAGNHMITQGWKESRRVGRHKLGSNVYRFFHAPFGGRVEFVADMDRMDKDWAPKTYEKNPGHNIWMLKSSGQETD